MGKSQKEEIGDDGVSVSIALGTYNRKADSDSDTDSDSDGKPEVIQMKGGMPRVKRRERCNHQGQLAIAIGSCLLA
jgi:hypothetical protein